MEALLRSEQERGPQARRRTTSWALPLGLAVGVLLYGLCFPPVGFWPVAYVALVPFAVACERAVAWRGIRGLLFWTWLIYALFWAVAGRWMLPVTAVGHVVLSIWMGLTFALAAVVLWKVQRAWRGPLWLTLPMVWVGFEVLRAAVPFGGMNWFMLGHTQAPWRAGQVSVVAQVADLFGQHTVSLFIAMVNGLIAELMVRPIYNGKTGRQKRMARRAIVGVFFTAMVSTLVLGYGQFRLDQTAGAQSEGPRIGLIQTNVPQDNKTSRTMAVDAMMWSQLMEGTRGLLAREAEADRRVDWVVWPETSVPYPLNPEAVMDARLASAGWGMMELEGEAADDESFIRLAEQMDVSVQALPAYMAEWWAFRGSLTDELAALSDDSGALLIVGAPFVLREQDEDRSHNSVFVVSPGEGIWAERYDKGHLVPFGESLPVIELNPGLKEWFIQNLTPYGDDYTTDPGQTMTRFELAFGDEGSVTAATPVCFEDTVARRCQAMVYEQGAKVTDVLVNVTNDGWFQTRQGEGRYGPTSQPDQQLQIATLRCIENRVPMVRAVNTGVSAFIGSNGRVEAILVRDGRRRGVEAAAARRVMLDRRSTLYGVVGDSPMWGLVGLMGVVWLASWFRKAKV